jgi:hypothetical protein
MSDADPVIEEFLDGQPRAGVWRELREALAARLADAVAERDAAPEGDLRRAELDKRVRELRDQVAALAQEEAVTQFVEDSVRATLTRPRPAGYLGDDEDEA